MREVLLGLIGASTLRSGGCFGCRLLCHLLLKGERVLDRMMDTEREGKEVRMRRTFESDLSRTRHVHRIFGCFHAY
jgi:hypothetical protein